METVRQLLKGKDTETFTVAPETTAHEAMELMAAKNVGALPVVEGDRLLGIISERDFARKMFLHERSAREIKISELMTSPVICVLPSQTRDECMALMTNKRVRHLPVVEDGKLLGLVSIGDLVKATIAEQQFIIEQLAHYISDSRI